MDSTDQLNNLDQSSLQNLLGGGSNASLIPDSLVTTLTIGFIALNIVSILFLIFYILGIIRKWKVQSAVLHMQKDLAEIKAHMVPVPAPQPESVIERPGESKTENQIN